jgi:hypothetical protein
MRQVSQSIGRSKNTALRTSTTIGESDCSPSATSFGSVTPKRLEIAVGLEDDDVQVRYVCATALGILRGQIEIEALERVVREDPNGLARSQAIVALGRIGATRWLELLRDRQENDDSKDVHHQAELSVDRIKKARSSSLNWRPRTEISTRIRSNNSWSVSLRRRSSCRILTDVGPRGLDRRRRVDGPDLGVRRLVSGLSP